MGKITHKVYAYITHGNRLLLFRQPLAPEAGIQVPGGTLEANEAPEAGVLREAEEETGLAGLVLVRFLGEATRHLGHAERHHCRFFHLQATGEPPESWQHEELYPSDGSPGPHIFEFFWVSLSDPLPTLIADMDALLPVLLSEPPHGP